MRTDVTVIGAGQAGLAASHFLTERGIEHLVFERGRIANSWRKERWDSLTLLSPNWHSQLPASRYKSDNPDGFMTKDETVDMLTRYSERIGAPVLEHREVLKLSKPDARWFSIETSQGHIKSKTVIVASGACNRPVFPDIDRSDTMDVQHLTAFDYKNPDQIQGDRVLIVGASASGVQISQELTQSGRDVWLSVGRHIRSPRRYRDRDIIAWLVDIGLFDQRLDDMADPLAASRTPSMQLSGNHPALPIDLNRLQDQGVQLVGRFNGLSGRSASFSSNLLQDCRSADAAMYAMLDQIDNFAGPSSHHAAYENRPDPTRIPNSLSHLDLGRSGITSIIWATGYRPDYSWLDLPVLSQSGRLMERNGKTSIAGLYALGLPFMRKRKSAFINGVGEDAKFVTSNVKEHLDYLSEST